MNWLKFDLLTIITITGVAQGIFLSSALLTTKRGEYLVNRMLVCLLFILSFDILFSIISVSQLLHIPSLFVRIDQCIKLLYGPITLIYMKVLLSHSFYFRKKDIIHVLPFLVSIICILPISLLSPNVLLANLAHIMRISINGFIDMMKVLFSTFVFIQLSVYLFYCYRKIIRDRSKMNIFNNSGFSVYRIFLFICSFYNLLSLLSSVVKVFMIKVTLLSYFPPLFITCIIYLFGYVSILKPGLLFIKWSKIDNNSVYKKVHLSEQKSKEYLNRLLSVMEKEKLYKDQDLTLTLLAEKIQLSRNLLSYLLNNVIGTNFYDFINGFRVKAVKDLLSNNSLENENILNIAFYAGFNSKSAFNKIFKKHTNMSPSQYRKVYERTKDKKIFSHMIELNLIDGLENSYGMKSIVRTS